MHALTGLVQLLVHAQFSIDGVVHTVCTNCESLLYKRFNLFRGQIRPLRSEIALEIALQDPPQIIQDVTLMVGDCANA